MITEIEIEGFKSLEKVRLKLGKLNLFVGANASGKSNFFDALRVLQGIGNGFSIEEIFQGKPKSATSEVWAGIRGGITMARFMRQPRSDQDDGLITFRVGLRSSQGSDTYSYSISISPDYGSIESEALEARDSAGLWATLPRQPDWRVWREFRVSGQSYHQVQRERYRLCFLVARASFF